MKTELCEKCGRPLWEKLCGYCRGYRDGVVDCKKRKIRKDIIEIINLKKSEIFPSVKNIDDKDIEYKLI